MKNTFLPTVFSIRSYGSIRTPIPSQPIVSPVLHTIYQQVGIKFFSGNFGKKWTEIFSSKRVFFTNIKTFPLKSSWRQKQAPSWKKSIDSILNFLAIHVFRVWKNNKIFLRQFHELLQAEKLLSEEITRRAVSAGQKATSQNINLLLPPVEFS